MTLLKLENISKRFDGLLALNNINLDIESGQIIGLVGDNGAGKSTLIKLISGNYSPSSGHIYIKNQEIFFETPLQARDAGIEVVYQDLALCGNLTAYENIFLGRESRYFPSIWSPVKTREMLEKSRSLISQLQSDTDVEKEVASMSGGQRQAIAISRTLLSDARLIIMDEPLAAISIRQVEQVLNLIKNLKQQGKAVLLVSHRLDDIFAVCDRIVILRRGEKVADRNTSEFTVQEVTGYITGAH
jgi:simple sugar transport system ATP-binding protein